MSYQKFLNDLDELYKILFDARSHYEIWWILINKEDRKVYFRTMLFYKNFFEIAAHANLSSMIISLYKLFEKREDTINLNNLVETAKKLKVIDDADLNMLGSLEKNTKDIWKKVAILRCNLLAHRSNKLSVKKIYELANITPNQIRDLTKQTLQILNFISIKINKKEKEFEVFISKDTYNLLKTLKISWKNKI